MKKGDIVYYARIFPESNTYEIATLTIRTVYDDYFVGTDEKTKHALMFSMKDIGHCIFMDKTMALERLKNAKENIRKGDDSYGAQKVMEKSG